MCGKQVIKQIKTSHQHLIIKHIHNRYKWKPIKGENHILLLLCSNSLSQLIFYRLQPTGGFYPKFCKLQLVRKLQLPSIFCRLQPTRGSYLNQLQLEIYSSNWTFIKIQLETEAPNPMYFLQATTHGRLLPEPARTGHQSCYNLK